jgi:hypothetical protein
VSKDQKKNGFEDEDLKTVLAELDEMDEEAKEVMASALGKVSAIRKRQKNRIKIADKELKIPSALIRTLRKQRKLERQLQDLANDVSEDLIELYADAAGQFSFLAPEEDCDHVEVVTPAQRAAQKAAKAAAENHEAEQVEGAEVLDGLAAAAVH